MWSDKSVLWNKFIEDIANKEYYELAEIQQSAVTVFWYAEWQPIRLLHE